MKKFLKKQEKMYRNKEKKKRKSVLFRIKVQITRKDRKSTMVNKNGKVKK